MIALLFYTVLGIASLYAMITGRRVFGLILLIGFTQDAVRKLTPGEPIIFIVTVGVLFSFALAGIWMRRGTQYSLEPFLHWTRSIQAPLVLFLIVLLLQLLHSFLRYGNLLVGLIGLASYVAPFLSVTVGYYLANSIEDVRKLMRIYVFSSVFVAASVVASFAGYDWTIFKEIGVGIKIYDQGTVLKSFSGIMRTGEIAAWHVSTSACLILALAMSSKKPGNLMLVGIIILTLMVVVALTGRRKMLMLTSLYVGIYFLTILYYRKNLDPKYYFSLFYVAVIAWFSYEAVSLDQYSESLGNYIARGSSVFNDATGRFVDLGLNPIQWAYNRVGLFGGGLGIASQGSYLFNVSDVAGGSGEGGLGKIMVELGLPGLLCIIWLAWSILGYVNNGLKLAAQPFLSRQFLPLMVSLAVMMGVNAVTFSVATQVYGDIFILIMLGLLGGFLLALPKIAINSNVQTQP